MSTKDQAIALCVLLFAATIGLWRGRELIRVYDELVAAEVDLAHALELAKFHENKRIAEEREMGEIRDFWLARAREGNHQNGVVLHDDSRKNALHKADSNPCIGNTQAFAFVPPAACVFQDAIVIAYFGTGSPPQGYVEYAPGLNAVVMFKAPVDQYTTLPDNLNNLPLLQWLVCRQVISGSIPASLFRSRSLVHLYLPVNAITGSIPTEIGLATQLTNLELQNNYMTGSIPSQIGKLVNLQHLDFSVNFLSGEFPSEIGNLRALNELYVDQNPAISGSIPAGLVNSTELKRIAISNCSMSGTIPSGISNLQLLTSLSLGFAQFSGTIPDEIYQLTTLSTLILAGNQFSGTISPLIALLNQTLTELDLSHNSLSSSLPAQIGLLTALTSLKLNDNAFTGQLPSTLKSLTALQKLTLSNNKFSGDLPSPLPPSISSLSCTNSGLGSTECKADASLLPSTTANIVFALAAIVCLATLILGTVVVGNVHYRHAVVASAGRVFVNAVSIAAIVVVLSVIPLGLSMQANGSGDSDSARAGGRRERACIAFVCMLPTGVVGMLATILVRLSPLAWSLHKKSETPKDVVTTKQFVTAVSLFEVGMFPLIAWGGYESFAPRYNFSCDLHSRIPLYLLMVYIVLLALATMVVCLFVRKASARFAETRSLARATLNLLFFGAALVILGFTTNDSVSRFLSVSLCILLCVLTFVLLYFGRMVVMLVKFPNMQFVPSSVNTSSTGNSHTGVSGPTQPFQFVTFSSGSKGASWADNDDASMSK